MLQLYENYACSCGKTHSAGVDSVIIENGAVLKLVDYANKYGVKKAFIVCDKNTYKVAGERVESLLKGGNINYSKYVFNENSLEPDEKAVGSLIMHYDNSCNLIIGVGSGVINDLSKILANVTKNPYIIVATAPSMDGYASKTSSMSMDGLKVSLPSKCANVIIGDIDILKTAPNKMLVSGLGDMLAKYISICEWRISNLITNEYYCEEVASIIRNALKKCVDNISGLLDRDDNAIKSVFEGLVLGGVAMNYAGLSRPASGVEHYFSHIWDMRGLEFNSKVDFHGIQCAIGSYYASKIYEQVKSITPDREKALNYVKNFDYNSYKSELLAFIGTGAKAMIESESVEGKYDIKKHAKRLEVIIDNWNKIIQIINEEVPPSSEIEKILKSINAPLLASDIGLDEALVPITFKMTKDIRDKYVLSRLCWDLGVIDEIKF